jgi:phosphoribosylformylglycinamidine cyclo-ligase
LARRALLDDGGLTLDDSPSPLQGASVADALLEPTVIYVRGILALLRSGLDVRGLAHITGGGLLNLLRIGDGVGFDITAPLPVPPVFELIAELGRVPGHEMWEVFNMGCGFCAVVAPADADAAVALLAEHHPGTAVVGRLTDRGGVVEVPDLRIEGGADGLGSA